MEPKITMHLQNCIWVTDVNFIFSIENDFHRDRYVFETATTKKAGFS